MMMTASTAARLRNNNHIRGGNTQRQLPVGAAPAAAPAGAPAGVFVPGAPAAAVAGAATLTGVTPPSGSLCGGSKLAVTGTGFSPVPAENQVFLGDHACEVVAATPTELRCVAPPSTGLADMEVPVRVLVRGVDAAAAPPGVKWAFASASTPMVTSFGPSSGQGGELLTFEGERFGFAKVTIGAGECELRRGSDLLLQCVLPPAPAGLAPMSVYVEDRGYACPAPGVPPLKFSYTLSVLNVRPRNPGFPLKGSFGGGEEIEVVGQGFSDADVVTLCESTLCTKTSTLRPDPAIFHEGDSSFKVFACSVGALKDPPGAELGMTPEGKPKVNEEKAGPEGYSRTCPLTVTDPTGTVRATVADAFTFVHEDTPEIQAVSRVVEASAAASSSSGGGELLLVKGEGFEPAMMKSAGGSASPVLGFSEAGQSANVTVWVGGRPCTLVKVEKTQIHCRAELHEIDNKPLHVAVSVLGKGLAVPQATEAAVLPPNVAKMTPEEQLIHSAPVALPSAADKGKVYTDAPCDARTLSTDCPAGWKCCQGRCAALCISLAQVSFAHPKL